MIEQERKEREKINIESGNEAMDEWLRKLDKNDSGMKDLEEFANSP